MEYSETTNEHGELVITATVNGIVCDQTIPVKNGSVLLFDTRTNNFLNVLIPDFDPDYTFIKFIP